jgi:hypothetical protein
VGGRYKFGHDFYRESIGPMPIWIYKAGCTGDEVSLSSFCELGREGATAGGGRTRGRRAAEME